ncbi:DUF2500 domain-containing protein [Tyzzerella sp. OttesenSCG-928-J15]|nr:DUF2500 domain-containing protein [Tyzzerella sp. OttesenSCG-928-J15]MDL2248237.1 DUF2500 domain-containing protein [Tyzzerella sp. OttesenSCG-928-J15]
MSIMFGIVPLVGTLFFIFVAAFIIIVIVKSMGRTASDSVSPVITANVKVVSRRTSVRNDFTHYFITFEFERGDRLEFGIDGRTFGMIAEGDNGSLTFQGSRFLGFQRYANMQ